jgi:hypothetical protein
MAGALHTPERLQIIRETWGEPVPIHDILARLNATPGCFVTGALAGSWAAQMKLKRNHDIIIAQQCARSKKMRPPPSGSPDDDREPVLKRLAYGEWTYERLTRLCALWDAGGTIASIAEAMGTTKNAVSGKIHRLGKQNLVHGRPSPIRPTERAEPAVTRSMGVPAPARTLPALPSEPRCGALPMLFNYPRHSRPPEPRPEPPTQWVADDGSWPTGPARHPCQFVTREGSVVVPWVHCGLPVARGAWCSAHLKVVWHRVARAA